MSASTPDLDALEAALARKAAVANELARVRATRVAEEGRRPHLAARLRSDRAALDALEGWTLRAVAAALTGRRGTQRERQRAAYLATRRAYDAWACGVAGLQAREAALDAEWLALHDAEAAYEAALVSREREIVQAGGAAGERLETVAAELYPARAEARALDDAANAASRAGAALDALSAALDEAEQSARSDLVGDATYVSVYTEQRMQRAREAADRVRRSLLRLRSAFAVVSVGDGRLRGAWDGMDDWMDSRMADWIVHRQLRQARERAARTRKAVSTLTIGLRARATARQQRVTELEAERRTLIRGEGDG